MFDEDPVEKTKQMAWYAEALEDSQESLVGEFFVKQTAGVDRRGVCPACHHPAPRQVIQRFAAPRKRRNHILFVQPCALMKITFLPFDVAVELLRKHHFEADAGVFEQLVVQQRPDKTPHEFGFSTRQVRFVDTVDQDDRPGVTAASQEELELVEQFIAIVGAVKAGEGLAGEVPWRKPKQDFPHRSDLAFADAHVPADSHRQPLAAAPSPEVRSGSQEREEAPAPEELAQRSSFGPSEIASGTDDNGERKNREHCIPRDKPVAIAEAFAERRPATEKIPCRRLVVAASEQEQVSRARAVHPLQVDSLDPTDPLPLGGSALDFADRARIEQAIDQLRYREAED